MERAWRQRVTRRCLREVATLHAAGTEVTVLGPGPHDLEAIGPNLMALERRMQVLETALATSREALADPETLDALPPAGQHPQPGTEDPGTEDPGPEEPVTGRARVT